MPFCQKSSWRRLTGVDVVGGLVPVFLLMGVGVAARQWGLLSDAAAAGLNRLVANLALPALLVLKIGTASLEASFSPGLVAVASAILVATTVLVMSAAAILGSPRRQHGTLAQAATRGNLAYVGFPVVLATLGEKGLEQAAVTAAVLIPLMNLGSVAVLELSREESERRQATVLWKILINPLVVSALAGLVLAAVGWRPWSWLAGTLEILSDFALPGALLALGAQLRLGQWGELWRPITGAAVTKLLIQPALAWWGLTMLGLSAGPVAVGVLLLAAPTAVASYPVAAELGGDTDLAGACVVVTTALGFVAYLGWAVVLSLS